MARQTAKICTISDLLKGQYIVREGWEPNYVNTVFGEVSRANIIGVVVSLENPLSFFLDDGSARILVRAFEGNLAFDFKTGDIVIVVGRPRVYNEELFVVPELARTIDPGWAAFRKKELELVKRPAESKPVLKKETLNKEDEIIAKIKELDKGQGVEIEAIISHQGQDSEKYIQKLIEEGVLYNNKPGFIKTL